MVENYFKADNTAALAKKNLENILSNGIVEKRQVGGWCMKKPKTEKIRETHAVTFELTDPRNCISSQHCLGAEVETEDYFLGLNPGYVHLSPWSFYKRWLDKNQKYHYTYGKRGGKYLWDVVKKLKENPTTRQCVVNLWRVERDLNKSFVPCTTQWNFFISDGKLNMVSTMRSQDACRGFFLDTFAYPIIQQITAKRLGIPMGSYRHIVLNSHIYDDDVEFAENIINHLNKEKPVVIDNLASDYELIMNRMSKLIFIEKDLKRAQEISENLSPFWKKWKNNQIIYVYTRDFSEQDYTTELTVAGLIVGTVMP